MVLGWVVNRPSVGSADVRSISDRTIVDWQLEGKIIRVEVVNTPASIQLGLSGRKSLTADGMLFVFDRPTQPVFWMKEMLFPIDIIWISNNRIVGSEKEVQPPAAGMADQELKRYPAPQLVDMVLEVPAGSASWD